MKEWKLANDDGRRADSRWSNEEVLLGGVKYGYDYHSFMLNKDSLWYNTMLIKTCVLLGGLVVKVIGTRGNLSLFLTHLGAIDQDISG